ncbi:MAG TPA: menaquinone biosynthesis decarboxylase [Candidatus Omnitrophota bacterium]|nr:menaquinone biosynthesis decarboxylase [Candidatus Omnitrophota bacterium]HPS37470.1 menaquinone biosynthesis decarboxylase [Candidatus Omnitrophota bacterium]
MGFKDLGQFIKTLRDAGELVEISASVDPVLEITEIYDRIVKKEGPALLFTNVKGSSVPLAINLFGSSKRMSLALGVEDVSKIAGRIRSFLDMKPPQGIFEKIAMIPKLTELNAVLPKRVKHAPCQEKVVLPGEKPILDGLPVVQCWPKDGGKFITFPLVITQDPQNGKRNVGLYRMHVYDDQTTGMHWQIHKDGAEHFRKLGKGSKGRLPVACVIGADPATLFSAACPLPAGIDELMLAGFLRKKPVELVKCKTVDLEVPADAEIVLEGYVEEGELRLEGPFGDHTGFYSRAKDFPVFHVTCMTHRTNPIYISTIVGRAPMEDCYIGKAIERIFLPMIQKQFPEILDICLPWEGAFHNCLIVSIKKSYPGQGKKIIHGIWGLGQMMFSKMIVVLDGDTNIQDLREVSWRVLNNMDPKRDIVFGEGPLDELDHGAARDFSGSKIGIDATRKGGDEGMERPWPEDIIMTDEIKRRVETRWKEYGLDPKYL